MSRLKAILAITALVKLAVLGLVLVGNQTLQFSEDGYFANFVYPLDEEPGLRSAFKTWDGNHYLYLAEHGYGPQHISNAYYPLLPAVIRLLRPLALGDSLLAGLIASNLFCLGAIAYLYLLVRKWRSEEVAFRTCLLLLAFPTSFYTGLVYTESLFLMLSIGLFYHLRERQPVPSLLFAAALPLTRPTGLLVLVPAIITAFSLEPDLKPTWRKLLVPGAFGLGFLAYLGIMKAFTGDFFAGFDAQKVFLANNSMANLLHPIEWFDANYLSVQFTLNGFTTSVLNRLCFVAFVACVVACYRCLPRDLFVYVLVVGAIPAMTGLMTSYIRYVAAAFPIFMCLGVKLESRAAIASVLIPSALLQASAVLVHSSNRWVA